MRAVSRRQSLLLALSLCIGAAGCGSEDESRPGLPAGAAARVGDKVISESAVRTRLSKEYLRAQSSLKAFGPPDYPACVAILRIRPTHRSIKDLRKQCRADLALNMGRTLNTLLHMEVLPREVDRRGIADAVDREARKTLAAVVKVGDPSTAVIDRPWEETETRMNAEMHRLTMTIPVSAKETAAYRKAHPEVPRRTTLGYTIQVEKLERLLHDRYASQITCAARYHLPSASLCR